MEIELSEIARRLANLIRPAVVIEVSYEEGLVRVESGGLDSPWLPFFVPRAGNTIDWDPPTPGEKCLLLSPDGETASGFVLAGIYSDEHPPPSNKAEEHMRKFEDGLIVSYDHKAHIVKFSRKEGLTLAVEATKLEIDADRVTIRNGTCDLIPTLSEAVGIIANSETPTESGPKKSIDNALKLPPLKKKLDSFAG